MKHYYIYRYTTMKLQKCMRMSSGRTARKFHFHRRFGNMHYSYPLKCSRLVNQLLNRGSCMFRQTTYSWLYQRVSRVWQQPCFCTAFYGHIDDAVLIIAVYWECEHTMALHCSSTPIVERHRLYIVSQADQHTPRTQNFVDDRISANSLV
jgi:hypothetical protein